MFDIIRVIGKETKEDLIDELFNQTYVVKSEFLRDNTSQLADAKKALEKDGFDEAYIENYTLGMSKERITGFYIQLPKNLSQNVMSEMNPIFRMFYTCEKESKKIMIGEETSLDTENILQNARLYIIECLHELIDGKLNSKLENKLKINSLNDFRIILIDEKLSKRLSNFIIQYVRFKLINITRSNKNPDFECIWDKHEQKYIFKKINKVYLDKKFNEEDDEDMHQIVEGVIEEDEFDIAEDTEEIDDNTFIRYIVLNYINKGELTNKQQEFWNDALRLGLSSKALKEIYSKQQINQFKKQILIRLENKLEKDQNVAFLPGRKICRWRKYFERDENGKFVYIYETDKFGRVKKKRVTKLDKYGEYEKEKYYEEVVGRWVLVEKYCNLKNNK